MFHKEGIRIILTAFVTIVVLIISIDYFEVKFGISIKIFLIIMLVLILQFFRNPKIKINKNENFILSPVDGKVVIIEEVYEPEFFKDKRIQISVFMSPLNAVSYTHLTLPTKA